MVNWDAFPWHSKAVGFPLSVRVVLVGERGVRQRIWGAMGSRDSSLQHLAAHPQQDLGTVTRSERCGRCDCTNQSYLPWNNPEGIFCSLFHLQFCSNKERSPSFAGMPPHLRPCVGQVLSSSLWLGVSSTPVYGNVDIELFGEINH